ncbi:DUF4179 domain-containing protein [Bacillus badius]|uniref:DUF4179 domain-containing protein n=1 Tax=Bacillus badius TaxID=1455 RepID=UPI000597DACF|nr:DUF4179 domain-containing protein [Bacillus badius]KIL73160.1 ECF-type sigma factor negative effector [Bacillus badius]
MKHPYELFNQIDSKTEEYEEIELSAAEKNKLKQEMRASIKPRKKKNRKFLIAAAFVLAAASPVMLTNDHVWASLSKAGKQIELFFNKPENEFTGYKQTVDQTATDKNIHVTLNELMLDDGQVLLSLNIKADNGDQQKSVMPGQMQVKIGDFTFANSSYSVQPANEKTEDGSSNYLYSFDIDHIDTDGDGLMDEPFQILDHIDPQKDYPVSIQFNTMEYEKAGGAHSGKYSDSFGSIKGSWTFQTTVNGENIQSNTAVYRIDKKIHINEKNLKGVLKIEEIRVSPVSVKIRHTFEYTKGSSESHQVNLVVKDEKGHTLTGSGTGSGTDTLSEMNEELELTSDLEKLIITPSIFDNQKNNKKLLKDQSFEVNVTK